MHKKPRDTFRLIFFLLYLLNPAVALYAKEIYLGCDSVPLTVKLGSLTSLDTYALICYKKIEKKTIKKEKNLEQISPLEAFLPLNLVESLFGFIGREKIYQLAKKQPSAVRKYLGQTYIKVSVIKELWGIPFHFDPYNLRIYVTDKEIKNSIFYQYYKSLIKGFLKKEVQFVSFLKKPMFSFPYWHYKYSFEWKNGNFNGQELTLDFRGYLFRGTANGHITFSSEEGQYKPQWREFFISNTHPASKTHRAYYTVSALLKPNEIPLINFQYRTSNFLSLVNSTLIINRCFLNSQNQTITSFQRRVIRIRVYVNGELFKTYNLIDKTCVNIKIPDIGYNDIVELEYLYSDGTVSREIVRPSLGNKKRKLDYSFTFSIDNQKRIPQYGFSFIYRFNDNFTTRWNFQFENLALVYWEGFLEKKGLKSDNKTEYSVGASINPEKVGVSYGESWNNTSWKLGSFYNYNTDHKFFLTFEFHKEWHKNNTSYYFDFYTDSLGFNREEKFRISSQLWNKTARLNISLNFNNETPSVGKLDFSKKLNKNLSFSFSYQTDFKGYNFKEAILNFQKNIKNWSFSGDISTDFEGHYAYTLGASSSLPGDIGFSVSYTKTYDNTRYIYTQARKNIGNFYIFGGYTKNLNKDEPDTYFYGIGYDKRGKKFNLSAKFTRTKDNYYITLSIEGYLYRGPSKSFLLAERNDNCLVIRKVYQNKTITQPSLLCGISSSRYQVLSFEPEIYKDKILYPKYDEIFVIQQPLTLNELKVPYIEKTMLLATISIRGDIYGGLNVIIDHKKQFYTDAAGQIMVFLSKGKHTLCLNKETAKYFKLKKSCFTIDVTEEDALNGLKEIYLEFH